MHVGLISGIRENNGRLRPSCAVLHNKYVKVIRNRDAVRSGGGDGKGRLEQQHKQ